MERIIQEHLIGEPSAVEELAFARGPLCEYGRCEDATPLPETEAPQEAQTKKPPPEAQTNPEAPDSSQNASTRE